MKVKIYQSEWYPVLELENDITLRSNAWPTIDIPDDLYKQYNEMEELFFELQSKIRPYYQSPNFKDF